MVHFDFYQRIFEVLYDKQVDLLHHQIEQHIVLSADYIIF